MATVSSTGSGTISSAGIGSGLDVSSIVTQLMALEQRPLSSLQSKASNIQSTVSEYGKIKSAVSTLRDLAAKLSSNSTWAQTVTNSSSSAVAATSNGSSAGTYSVEVSSLASGQTLATAVPMAKTGLLGAGTLHIELGAWGAGQTVFAPNGTATLTDIMVSDTDTLETVRDKINAAGGGVSASILSDSSGSRLLIRSNATGAANGFRTSVTDADGDNGNASGLSALAYDPSAGVSQMTRSQTASDAAATVNGLAVSSATNTLSNLVDGLTLNLSATTSGPVTVNVVVDNDSLKKTITDFAAAYTSIYKLIATDTKYNPTTKTGGVLQGDSAATGLQRQLRTLAGGSSDASSMFSHLSDAGLQIQSDGSMTVNESKLSNALGNLGELKKLFANTDVGNPSNDGFAKRFRDVSDTMLGVQGSLSTRTDGLNQQLQRNQKDQESLNVRLAGIEKRLRAQYTSLDAKMAALTTQSSYLTQQIASWNSNKS